MTDLQQLINEAAATSGVFDGQGREFTVEAPVYIPPPGNLTLTNLTISNISTHPNVRRGQPIYLGSFAVQDLTRILGLFPDQTFARDDIVCWRSRRTYDVNGWVTPYALRIGRHEQYPDNPLDEPAEVINVTAGQIGQTPGLDVPLGFVRNVTLRNVTLKSAGGAFGLGRCGVVGLRTHNLEINAGNPGPSNGLVDAVMVNTHGTAERCALEVKIGCQSLVIDGWNFRAYGDTAGRDNLPLVTLGQGCQDVHVSGLAVNGNGAGFRHAVRTTDCAGCSIEGTITTDSPTTIQDEPGGCDLSGLSVYGGSL